MIETFYIVVRSQKPKYSNSSGHDSNRRYPTYTEAEDVATGLVREMKIPYYIMKTCALVEHVETPIKVTPL